MLEGRESVAEEKPVNFKSASSRMRTSLVTVPTSTAIFLSLPFISLAIFEIDMGGRFDRDMKRRFSTTALNLASVLRAKKRYSLTRSLMYTFSDFGAFLNLTLALPTDWLPLSKPWKKIETSHISWLSLHGA